MSITKKKPTPISMLDEDVIIYCSDCRGKFNISREDLIEGELIECDLCSAELEVMMEEPLKIRLYSEDNIF